MEKEGVSVERPVQPAALSISEDQRELEDPDSYPIKVSCCLWPMSFRLTSPFRSCFTN